MPGGTVHDEALARFLYIARGDERALLSGALQVCTGTGSRVLRHAWKAPKRWEGESSCLLWICWS